MPLSWGPQGQGWLPEPDGALRSQLVSAPAPEILQQSVHAVSAFCLSSPSTLHGDVYYGKRIRIALLRNLPVFTAHQSKRQGSLPCPADPTRSGRSLHSPAPRPPGFHLAGSPRAPPAPGAPPTLSLRRVAAGFLHLVPGAEACAAVLTADACLGCVL